MLINLPIPDRMKSSLQVLPQFSALHHNSYIAGGWPRDMYLGCKPKDIDVWELGIVDTIWRDLHSDELLKGRNYTGGCGILGIKQIEGCDNIFVSFQTIEELLNDFDLSICQIAVDNTGQLLCTEAFKHTIETKVVTFGGDRTSTRRKRRIERLKIKYPDYQWPDPDNLGETL